VPCPGLNDQTGERAPVVDWLPVIPAAASILSRPGVIVGILPIVRRSRGGRRIIIPRESKRRVARAIAGSSEAAEEEPCAVQNDRGGFGFAG